MMPNEKKVRKKHNPRRKPSAIARDNRLIARLYLARWQQEEIAEHLGLSTSTISVTLKKFRQGWQKEAEKDFAEVQAMLLATVDDTHREARAAWERSKEPREVVTTKKVLTEDGEQLAEITTKREEKPSGDKRFLDAMRDCVDQYRKIYGFSDNIKISGDKEQPLVIESTNAQETLLSKLLEVASEDEADESDK